MDVLAGLITAAVVIPKAMAYATIAGLPVQIGLYTALVPMAIYAVLGTSRPLSVSTTTTIAILTGALLGEIAPDADPADPDPGDRHLERHRWRHSARGVFIAARLRRELHFRAGPDRLQGGNRARHRARPGPQAPRHPLSQDRLLPQSASDRATPSRDLAGRRSRWASPRSGSWSPSSTFCRKRPAPLVVVAAGIAAMSLFGLQAHGVEAIGAIPRGLPSITLPELSLVARVWPAAVGIALMSFTETIAAARAFARSDEPPLRPNRELLATGLANAGGGLFGAMPSGGGTSQTAVNRRAGARTQIVDARDRGSDAADDAPARTAPGRHAAGRRWPVS